MDHQNQIHVLEDGTMSQCEYYLHCINKVVRSFFIGRTMSMKEVMEISSDRCIYRGESECYDNVSSSLYRHYEKEDERWDKLSNDQKEKVLMNEGMEEGSPFRSSLEQSHPRDPERDEKDQESDYFIKFLERNIEERIAIVDPSKDFFTIQHLGGKTNWIDFTDNPLVALFFSCSEEKKDGRIIIAKESSFSEKRIKRLQGENRYVNPLQGSVLVRPESGGVIDITNAQKIRVLPIPKRTKSSILHDLRERYGISFVSLFHDIHGYIRGQKQVLCKIKYEEVENPNRDTVSYRPYIPLSRSNPVQSDRTLCIMEINKESDK